VIAAGVFCDFVSVSFSQDSSRCVIEGLAPLLDAAGFVSVDEGPSVLAAWRPFVGGEPGVGRVGVSRRYRVAVCSVSGTALHALRSAGLLGHVFGVLGAVPHRVTRLDATLEVADDGPAVVAAVAARARAGSIALSRKSLGSGDVFEFRSLDASGRLTGTVYLGSRQAEVRGVVYDKRHERICKGAADPGPLVRYEVRVSSRFGPTLRDAYDPVALFWHFASGGLLPRPSGVKLWVSQSEGFTMPEPISLEPAQLMQRKLDHSPDVVRLIELAKACGPGGLDLLFSRLRKLAVGVAPAVLSGRPSGAEVAQRPSA